MLKVNTIRRKLILGLIPGFIVLMLMTGVSYFGLRMLAQANAQLMDTSEELDAIKSLQLSMLEVLMPSNDYLILGEASGERELFDELASKLDVQLAAARPHFGEEAEQRLLDRAVAGWQDVRRRSEAILAMPAQPISGPAGVEMEALDAAAAAATEDLEQLHVLVHQEMAMTVAASAAARRTATWLLLISAAVSVAGGVLFTALFSRHLTDPIVTLRTGAARIGAGDLNFRLQVRSNDELGTLAAEFNRMAARLQNSYAHLEERVAARTAQLRALDEAGRAVASELNLDRVLQTIVNLSLELSGASHAAILVPRRDGGRPRFLTASVNSATFSHLDQLPEGRGLLDALLQESKPVRLSDLTRHPASVGFPPGHPPMRRLLGVPIIAHGETIGALYMTNRTDGHDFSEEDEQVMTMLAAHAAVAIENARLYGEIHTMNEALEVRVQERTAQLKAVSEERARYAGELRQVLERTVRVQEEERERIAKEVHDGVSQWLMGALYEMQAAKVYLNDRPEEAAGRLSEAQTMLRRVKDEMQRVIYDLHPPVLESNGLVAALRTHTADFQTLTGVPCRVQVSGTPRRLKPEQELALYRIAQEALHNAAAHAAASRVAVMVDFGAAAVRLRIADDGRGFHPAQARDSDRPRLGLLGMHERAYSVGGTVSVQSSPGQGTTISVQVPLTTGALDEPAEAPAEPSPDSRMAS